MGRRVENKAIDTAGAPKVSFKGTGGDNVGAYVQEYHHSCFANNGHFMYAKLIDPDFNVLGKLVAKGEGGAGGAGGDESIGDGWLDSRKKPVELNTKLKWEDTDNETEELKTIITNFRSYCNYKNYSYIEFTSIDPPSYKLGNGTKSDGKAYTGNVKSVIEQVVKDYGDGVELEMSDTKDNKKKVWYMNRMDPKNFIMSLLSWSTSLTDKKSKWMVFSDNKKIIIKEQAAVESKMRSTYKWGGFSPKTTPGSILEYECYGDHSIGLLANKITTNAISSVSGAYLEYSSDINEDTSGDKRMAAFDSTTSNKVIPKTDKNNSPARRDVKDRGWTSVNPIPEFYDGELGMNYRDYIDGVARNNYYKTLDKVMRCRIRVPGHYIWDSCEGLGVDTIKVDWKNIDKESYFMEGTWIVNGFHHEVQRDSAWYTDLYLSRFDHDAEAKKVK